MKNRVLHVVCRAALATGLVSFVFGAAVADAEPFASVDYGSKTGKLNKYLHCSSWAPRSYPRGLVKDDVLLKPLRLQAFRTHDAPLVNNGQRVTATVLDNDRDLLGCPVEFRNGKVKLTKAERRSAAFFVTFEF